MSEVEDDPLIRKAIGRQFVTWEYPEAEQSVLRLGQKFDDDVEALLNGLKEAQQVFIYALSEFSQSEIELAAGLNGATLPVEREDQLAQAKKVARSLLPKCDREMLIAIGAYPDELADYKYWGMRDRVSVNEFVWLSIGLEPKDDLEHYFPNSGNASRSQNEYVKKEAVRRRELFLNASGLRANTNSISMDAAHLWLQSVDLEVPVEFRDALQKAWDRLRPKPSDPAKTAHPDDDRKPDPREMRSMARFVTAIAIDAYGYDPSSKRSSIPKELEGIADELGLSVSKETIRKYLQMGARLIDDN